MIATDMIFWPILPKEVRQAHVLPFVERSLSRTFIFGFAWPLPSRAIAPAIFLSIDGVFTRCRRSPQSLRRAVHAACLAFFLPPLLALPPLLPHAQPTMFSQRYPEIVAPTPFSAHVSPCAARGTGLRGAPRVHHLQFCYIPSIFERIFDESPQSQESSFSRRLHSFIQYSRSIVFKFCSFMVRRTASLLSACEHSTSHTTLPSDRRSRVETSQERFGAFFYCRHEYLSIVRRLQAPLRRCTSFLVSVLNLLFCAFPRSEAYLPRDVMPTSASIEPERKTRKFSTKSVSVNVSIMVF